MAGQSKRVDSIVLPAYPILADRNLTQYFRALTTNLQWWADQSQQAIDNGLVPYQSISIGVTVTNGAIGQIETFALPLPAGTKYSVIVTPHWSTAVWVSPTSVASFTVNFTASPSATSTMDLLVYFSQLLP